ncbi:hypothetical protein HRJ34_14780 [Rhizorhabdus wittichii]|uniref:Uncharacterized protein n=1 Tax=Rhizorhabdus wittichii TaxID=160791 RepID=A0A975CXK3_9SPHN|nr:hypothetical protein [Rhizorhabdus wittichii]QTH19640.1 hypothetical protein HRJ34_14780 [Rhizorhabdus wittichii]
MDDGSKAILLWNQELLATLIKRMAGAGVLNEHGADALAEEVRQYATSKHPEFERQFLAHAAYLQTGIREECDRSRAKRG